MNKVIGADLFDEKNLWSIYKQCVLKLPRSTFNSIATTLVFVFLCIDCLFFDNFSGKLEFVRSLSDSGLGFGSTILGFLIAGFTIFATLTKPEVFMRLYETQNKEIGLSFLKIAFFSFVEAFIVFIAFMVLCLLLKTFGAKGGLVSSFCEYVKLSHQFSYSISKVAILNVGYVILSTLAFYSLMALKSFVYNIYHTVILSLVWALNEKTTVKNDGTESEISTLASRT